MNETLATVLTIFLGVLTAIIVITGLMIWKVIGDLRSLLGLLHRGADTLTQDAHTFSSKVNHLASTANPRNYRGMMNVAGIGYTVIRWYLGRRKIRKY